TACKPQDVQAQGPCAMVLGMYWDGAACVTLSGCSCVGSDCSHGFEESHAFPTGILSAQETCEKAYRGCLTCAPQDGHLAGNCAFLGPIIRWDGKKCVQETMGCSCKGPDCPSLYSNSGECIKAHAACP
ncbi:MAG TPA: hypothetical protein PKK83_20590, partial [Polyangiaceae bacterium]|nr:hypothetical protein [Polyangiaceae bacterium]HOH03634.1 hypothetical protein [Polyangiaceae bacterium]